MCFVMKFYKQTFLFFAVKTLIIRDVNYKKNVYFFVVACKNVF